MYCLCEHSWEIDEFQTSILKYERELNDYNKIINNSSMHELRCLVVS